MLRFYSSRSLSVVTAPRVADSVEPGGLLILQPCFSLVRVWYSQENAYGLSESPHVVESLTEGVSLSSPGAVISHRFAVQWHP